MTQKINPSPNPAQHPFVTSFLAHVLFLTNMKHIYEQGVPKKVTFWIVSWLVSAGSNHYRLLVFMCEYWKNNDLASMSLTSHKKIQKVFFWDILYVVNKVWWKFSFVNPNLLSPGKVYTKNLSKPDYKVLSIHLFAALPPKTLHSTFPIRIFYTFLFSCQGRSFKNSKESNSFLLDLFISLRPLWWS